MSAQIECGRLTPRKNASGKTVFKGNVSLSGVVDGVMELTTHPRANPENDRSPSYEVMYTPRGKGPFLAGAAWLKNSDNVEGGDYLTITMDAVNWKKPVNLAAFPPEKDSREHEWRLVWSRPKGARVQDDYNLDDDEIGR